MKRFQLHTLLLAVILAGCRSNEPFDNIVTAVNPDAFNYVTSTGGRANPAVFGDAGYYIVFDDDQRIANLTISNLRVSDSDEPMTLSFSRVPMTYSSDSHEKERVIMAETLVPDNPDGPSVTLSDVLIVYSHTNSLDPNRTDGIYARFTVNGRYTVTAYPYRMLADGTTRIDCLTDGKQQIEYEPVYGLRLDPATLTASLVVKSLDLAGVERRIVIRDLTLGFVDNGYTLSMSGATVCAADKGAVKLVSVSGTAELRTELKIDMVLSVDGADYRVAAFLSPNLGNLPSIEL